MKIKIKNNDFKNTASLAIFSHRHHGANEYSGRCSQEHQQRGEEGQTPGPHQAVFQSHRSVPDCDDEAWLHW